MSSQNGTTNAPSWQDTFETWELEDGDRQMLIASAICPAVAKARGYRSIKGAEAIRREGFSKRQAELAEGLLCPVLRFGELDHYQLRPYAPRLDRKGKPIKYETPEGTPPVLDVHPFITERVLDLSEPLWITEGVKKADSAISHGLCCTALTGVWNWGQRNDETGRFELLPDFDAIPLEGREVIICFDSDVMTKPQVSKALKALRKALVERGATLKLVYLPDAEDGSKQGIDDYLASRKTADDLYALATDEVREPLDRGDFLIYLPTHKAIYRPTGDVWELGGLNASVGPIQVGTNPETNRPITIRASDWLATRQAVQQMTWAPGRPEVIEDALMNNGGLVESQGSRIYNRYRPPLPLAGDPSQAEPWLEHLRRLYPDDRQHIVAWCAHRVQRPGEKVNHALVLGGYPGDGKDTLLQPVIQAVGPWNVGEASPSVVIERFNAFLRNVILRVSEARDLGEVNRYGFYEHMKPIIAAPPDVLRIDEKYLGAYHIPNVVSIVYTTNNRTTGLYLPADDRRHYVAWSEAKAEDFPPDYFPKLYGWYQAGGYGHVRAYLEAYDLSTFDPKAPPRKTPAFWAMVDADRAPEHGELGDVLEALGNPKAVTIARLAAQAQKAGAEMSGLYNLLTERKHRRQVPHTLEAAKYVAVRNENATDGLWKVAGKRQAVYALSALSGRDRIAAAQELASVASQ